MAFSNNMTKLVNKLERRLGTCQLNLPDHLQKDKWAEVIKEDTLTTFSRYLPNVIKYEVLDSDRKGDYYIIDENKISPDVEILGVRDLSWDDLNMSGGYLGTSDYGFYDYWANPYNLEDIAMTQMVADSVSLFNNNLFVDFVPPNKLDVKCCANVQLRLPRFKVDLLIKHSDNLNTIAPTKMELFEALAKADVATFLYNELKYYDGLETTFSTVDIKLSDIQDSASKRDDIVEQLRESYVSAANDNQPFIITTG